jgi:hypothetical protein
MDQARQNPEAYESTMENVSLARVARGADLRVEDNLPNLRLQPQEWTGGLEICITEEPGDQRQDVHEDECGVGEELPCPRDPIADVARRLALFDVFGYDA